MITWIPLKTWSSWTPEERGQIAQYYESIGRKWAIDLNSVGEDVQKDYQEEADTQGVTLSKLLK